MTPEKASLLMETNKKVQQVLRNEIMGIAMGIVIVHGMDIQSAISCATSTISTAMISGKLILKETEPADVNG